MSDRKMFSVQLPSMECQLAVIINELRTYDVLTCGTIRLTGQACYKIDNINKLPLVTSRQDARAECHEVEMEGWPPHSVVHIHVKDNKIQ
jgi:hypothetical protein